MRIGKSYTVDVMQVVPVPFREEVLLITQMDMSKDEGTFKVFYSYKEADQYVHDVSLQQFPEWHELHCPKCKGQVQEITPLEAETRGIILCEERECLNPVHARNKCSKHYAQEYYARRTGKC